MAASPAECPLHHGLNPPRTLITHDAVAVLDFIAAGEYAVGSFVVRATPCCEHVVRRPSCGGIVMPCISENGAYRHVIP